MDLIRPMDDRLVQFALAHLLSRMEASADEDVVAKGTE